MPKENKPEESIYVRKTVTVRQRLGHVVEECGELCSAIGKAQRWGLESSNPELPVEERETNVKWIQREMADVELAISRLRSEFKSLGY